MATDTIRRRLSAVAVKTETTPGVDAFGGADPALTDFVGAQATFELGQRPVEDPSLNGSFDAEPPIVGGLQATITLRLPLRGSKTAGTPPEWGKLATASRMEEVVQSIAVGAPTAATAGTANNATLAAPFAATSDVYTGMPMVLSGNPAAAKITTLISYTAARIATFIDTFNPVLNTATLAQIPINVLYRLTDDETLIKPVTIVGYEDGLRHKFVGGVGSPALELTAGGIGFLTFTMRGQVVAFNEAAPLIPGWNDVTRPQPPLWINGTSRLNRQVARISRYQWTGGVQFYDVENPEALEGYDPPQISSAAQQITMDPIVSTITAATLFGRLKSGANLPFGAILGNTLGNRIGITHPALRLTNMAAGDRGGFKADQMTLVPTVAGAGTYITVF
jgi:hypothetical protein